MLLRAVLRPRLSHGWAVVVMLLVTLLWATAGVMTRQITDASGVEVTFWRSLLAAGCILLILRLTRGPGSLRRIPWDEPMLWLSGLCWAGMFTAFMMALSFTTVANVLVLSALGPVFTALISHFILKEQLPRRTRITVLVAAAGIVYIYAAHLTLGYDRKLIGSLIALLVPVCSCAQWTLMHRERKRLAALRLEQSQRAHAVAISERTQAVSAELPGDSVAQFQNPALELAPPPIQARDMVPALAIGGFLSALVCLPFAWPFQASWPDMGWLAALGLFQLAIPCALAVIASRVLSAPELSLLALLEIIFGILLTWWGAGEVPGPNVVIGGSVVLLALAINEILGWRQSA